jgi:4-amino-4-deoxy-L-arabinose transferase-like glycosyltransferase
MRRPLIWILILALGTRLVGIAARPIWYDEAFAILFARAGLPAMLYGTLAPDALGAAADIHPLGYYTVLWGWMKLWGTSLPAVRALSVLYGLGIVALGYALSGRLFGARAGVLAGILLAVSPFQIHYAQEIRMYAQVTLLLMGAVYAMERGLHTRGWRNSWGWWALFAVLAAAAQYTHNLAAFFLVPLALTPILHRDWRAAGATALAGLGALALYAPWLAQLPAQLGKVQTAYWTARPTAGRLASTLLAFTTNLPVPDAWLLPALFAALFLFALALWQTARTRTEKHYRGLWLLWLALAPPILMFGVSQIVPVYLERALLPSGAFFVLWLGWVFTVTPMPRLVRRFGLVLAGVAGLMGLVQHVGYRGFPYHPPEVNAALAAPAPGGVIIHSNKLTYFPAVYYTPHLQQTYLADPPGSGSDTLALPTQEVLGHFAIPGIAAAVGNASRVRLVIFTQAITELGGAPHPHLLWLDEHFQRVSVQAIEGLEIYEFSR